MAWHTVVIAVLALAVACDLYLRGRALLKERRRARAGMLAWSENRKAFYELAGREFERARRYDHPFTLGYFDLDDYQEVAERLFSPTRAEKKSAAPGEHTSRHLAPCKVACQFLALKKKKLCKNA